MNHKAILRAEALIAGGFDGPTMLEVAGSERVIESAKRLRQWIN
jgi:hypothetical protein